MNRFCYGIATLLALATTGCQEDVKRQIQSEEVTINDSNKLSVSDSIYYISNNSFPNRITLLTDVPEGNLHFSINNGQFKPSGSQSVTLQKQDSILQYYFTKKNFDNSVVKTIVFPKHAKRFLDKISLNTSIIDSSLNINVVDKSRGVIMLEVYTLNGTRLIERSHFKGKDELSIQYALESYPAGFYILRTKFGKDLKILKLLKK